MCLSPLWSIFNATIATPPIPWDEIETKFFGLFELLGNFPELGHPRRDLTRRALRFFPVEDWLVVYGNGDGAQSAVEIVAVLHGARNIRAILRNRRP